MYVSNDLACICLTWWIVIWFSYAHYTSLTAASILHMCSGCFILSLTLYTWWYSSKTHTCAISGRWVKLSAMWGRNISLPRRTHHSSIHQNATVSRTANMSWRTCVVVKQIHFNQSKQTWFFARMHKSFFRYHLKLFIFYKIDYSSSSCSYSSYRTHV